MTRARHCGKSPGLTPPVMAHQRNKLQPSVVEVAAMLEMGSAGEIISITDYEVCFPPDAAGGGKVLG